MAKFSKGVRKGKNRAGTPVPRRVAPRGKPFEKGNSYGIATRFAPGVSGNPSGCPKYKKYSDSLRAMVAADVNEKFTIQTGADAVARKVFKLAKRGNMGAIRELGDRCEGKPAQSIQVSQDSDPLLMLCEEMRIRHEQITAGNPPAQLPEATEELEEANQ